MFSVSVNNTMASRFGNLSNLDTEEIEGKVDKESTKRVIEKSVRIFRAFLREKGRDESFESLSSEELDDELKSLYAFSSDNN